MSLSDLISVKTAAAVLNQGLDLAAGLGLPVTTWRVGDPTRSLYAFQAALWAGDDTDPDDKGLQAIVVEYIKAGFLTSSRGAWKTLVAKEFFGVDRVVATYATPTVTLRNTAGGFYPLVAGGLTVKASSSGKTYHSTDDGGGPLSGGVTRTYNLIADDPGSDSSAIANDIDTLVTSLVGVVVESSTAGVGADEQTDPELDAQCLATLGALSPNGPADAYEYVCRQSKLTGVFDVTRAKALGDSTTGQVTIGVAGAAGPVAGASLIACQSAVQKWATPLCITPSVTDASGVSIAVTAILTGAGIPSDFSTRISLALAAAFSAFDIADAAGAIVDTTFITAIMRTVVPQIVTIAMSAPAAPVALSELEYPTLGAVALTLA